MLGPILNYLSLITRREDPMGKCSVTSVAGAFLLLLAIAPRVSGQAELTVSGGILLPGEAYVEEWDVYPEIDMSPMVSLSYDSYQVPSLGFGVFLNAASLSVEGESGTMITLGGAVKPRWMVGAAKDHTLDVSLGIGYRSVSSDELDDSIQGLALNCLIELTKPMVTRDLIFSFGFISQPTGGNEDITVTWAPIFHLGIGISF